MLCLMTLNMALANQNLFDTSISTLNFVKQVFTDDRDTFYSFLDT